MSITRCSASRTEVTSSNWPQGLRHLLLQTRHDLTPRRRFRFVPLLASSRRLGQFQQFGMLCFMHGERPKEIARTGGFDSNRRASVS